MDAQELTIGTWYYFEFRAGNSIYKGEGRLVERSKELVFAEENFHRDHYILLPENIRKIQTTPLQPH